MEFKQPPTNEEIAMNVHEAIAALDSNREVHVRTKSGAEYAVAWDILDVCLIGPESSYVYGYRTNGSSGPFANGNSNGSIKWFDLKNAVLVES